MNVRGRLAAGVVAAVLLACGCMLSLAGEGPPEEVGDPGAVGDADGWREVPGETGREAEARGDDVAVPDAPLPDGAGGDGVCPSGTAELCNDIDDDCDGETDEGMQCRLGTEAPCGPCGLGRQTCSASCTWNPCELPPGACDPGTTETCAPPTCAVGTRTCGAGCAWGPCLPDHTDCAPGTTRSCSVPRCGTGTETCNPDCTWGGCVVRCSPSDLTCCPDIGCVNLDWDPSNCGACGHRCGFLSGCTGGDCWW